MAYLLADDPEILFWDHQGNVFQNVPWARELEFQCTLHKFHHHAGATWHIGHCKGTYGVLLIDCDRLRGLCDNLVQVYRQLTLPSLSLPPLLAPPLPPLLPPAVLTPQVLGVASPPPTTPHTPVVAERHDSAPVGARAMDLPQVAGRREEQV